MKFLTLLLVFFLVNVLASHSDDNDEHIVVKQDVVTLPEENVSNPQHVPQPVKKEKLLPWPFNSFLPRSLRRISFRKLTIYILKQPFRFIRYIYSRITGTSEGDNGDDSKNVIQTQ